MRASLALALAVVFVLAGAAGAMHPQQAGSHTTTFDHKTGNDWWVEVIVSGSPSKVEARDDGGAWTQLTLKSWGAWAASFRIEPGHRVQFRASWSDGASVESCWFTHPDGVEQCETTPPPPPPSGEYTFTHGGGNEWWVEVKVSPMPGKVEAMDTGGNWVPLSFRSWGEWANSFRIEPGHQVRFRAFGDNAWHESCWFTHPDGKPVDCGTTPPPPPTNGTLVSFTHAGGNEWWIEGKITPKPAKVEAMDTGGDWVALSFRSWGEWAGSFHIEPNHQVRFRATLADGSTAMSCWFWHPYGTVVEDTNTRTCTSSTGGGADNGTWPREGSYVKYYVDEGEHWPSGADWYELNVTLRYVDGKWQQDVEGWNYFRLDGDPDLNSQTRIRYTAASEGPEYSTPPADANDTTYSTKKNGGYVDAPALVWGGPNDPDCPCGDWREIAHEGTGLTLSHHRVGRMSHGFIDVKDTDAPIAPGDAEPTPPPAPAWPTEGSFASYEVHEWYNGSSSARESHFTMTYRYTDGDWLLTCTGTETQWDVNGTNPTTTPFERVNNWSWIPVGPLDISAGAMVQVGHPTGCGTHEASWYADSLVAKSKLKLDVTRDGEPYRASVWYADGTDADEDAGADYDRWWDLETGLTLQWEERYDWPWTSIGKLLDTDAPLRAG